MHYTGHCHCGAVTFAFESEPIQAGLRCNCSLCERKGATMTAFTVAPAVFKLTVTDDALAHYRFGDQTATHYFCKRCGIYPFHHPASQPDSYRINIGCLDQVNASDLPFEVYDGAALP